MANELIINHSSGSTLYALLFDATGNVWNGSSFAAPASASWTDYDIAMTEVATATGIYRASRPAAAAGVYGWVVRKQAGGPPAVTDIAVGSGEIRWTGTAEETIPASANVTYSAGIALTGRLAQASDLTALGNAGLYSYSATVDDGANPLDGVFIQCATDAGFTNVIATTYSNASGAYTVRSDQAGTHYLRFHLAGWNFSDETVTLV